MCPRTSALETAGIRLGLLPVMLRYGFMEEIDVPAVLSKLKECGPSAR